MKLRATQGFRNLANFKETYLDPDENKYWNNFPFQNYFL